MATFKTIKSKTSKFKISKIIIGIFLFIALKLILTTFNISHLITSNILGNKLNPNFFFQNSLGFQKIENNLPTFKENNLNSNIQNILSSDYLVYIYNTYQTDKYYSTYQSSYNINPYVIESSLMLNEELKKYQINSLVETRSIAKTLKEINKSYNYPYEASRTFLEDTLNKYPTIKYFLDIQLSNSEEEDLANINGVNYAKILFVIGTKNPNYNQNLKFAQSLNNILNTKYPNISKGIDLREGAGYNGLYNQDLNPNILLMEIGNKKTKIENVYNTIKILSEVLAKYIEENYEN